MPKKDRKDNENPANTFIGPGITVKAEMSGSASARIDGSFEGNIHLEGDLQVGGSGRIKGDIWVSYALIAGTVEGNIMCRATVHLASTAKVIGDITTGLIIVDKGAVFYGHCKTRDAETEIVVV